LKHYHFFDVEGVLGVTDPFNFSTSLPLAVFVNKVSVLDCLLGLPAVLKLASTSAESPGFIGSLGHTGTVHPQDGCTLDIIKSVLPELVTTYFASTITPSFTVPKSYSVISNLISAAPLLISTSLFLAVSRFSFFTLTDALSLLQEIIITTDNDKMNGKNSFFIMIFKFL